MPRVRVPRHVTWLVTQLVVDYCASCRLVVDYFAYAARPDASAHHAARRRLLRLAQARHQLLRLRRASGCFGSSRGLSCDSSSTTSPLPRVRVPWHVARLVTRLVVDYCASRRLVVDCFAYAARPGASARRAARHATHCRLLHLAQARRRLLRLPRASGCFGTSCGSSRGSSSTTLPSPRIRVPRLVAWLVVDYLDYAAHLVASARRTARLAARCAARHRLLRLAQARRRLLRLHHASGCLGTSRGSSCGSSSTTSPTPCVHVPRHVERFVKRLVVYYLTYAARPVAWARRAACRMTHRRLLRLRLKDQMATREGGTNRSL
jgi:hypothetical protein